MFEKLTEAVDRRADQAVVRTIDRLIDQPLPPGIVAQASDRGVTLSGRNLRRRMLTDTYLRNFGR
jgi:hypothetical protein